MYVLVIPPDATAYLADLPDPDYLEPLCQLVAGDLEAVTIPVPGTNIGATMYLNERGKLDDLPINDLATHLAAGRLTLGDTIVGTAVICGPPTGDGRDTDVPGALITQVDRVAGVRRNVEAAEPDQDASGATVPAATTGTGAVELVTPTDAG